MHEFGKRAIKTVVKELFKENVLVQESEVAYSRATVDDLDSLVELYSGSKTRGDWFGGRLKVEG